MKKLVKKELLENVEKFIEEGNAFLFASDKSIMYCGPEFQAVPMALLHSIILAYSEATNLSEEKVQEVLKNAQMGKDELEKKKEETLKKLSDEIISRIFGGGEVD